MLKEKVKKPSWLRVKIPRGERYQWILNRRKELDLATVCEEARCPNIGECWSSGTATFMVMGEACTRGCRFCNVKTKRHPEPLDPSEPEKLAGTIRKMELDYIVLTSVDRDDLSDQGATHVRQCIETVQRRNPNLLVEILSPDFQGKRELIAEVLEAKPAVFAHNVETVRRLTRTVRDRRAGYGLSLDVLSFAKEYDSSVFTKSSLMVGLGETKEEIVRAMKDLRERQVDFLTVGQYLQPRQGLLQVSEFVTPATFREYEAVGLDLGFRYVASGPLVRSSYKAAEHFITGLLKPDSSFAGKMSRRLPKVGLSGAPLPSV